MFLWRWKDARENKCKVSVVKQRQRLDDYGGFLKNQLYPAGEGEQTQAQ